MEALGFISSKYIYKTLKNDWHQVTSWMQYCEKISLQILQTFFLQGQHPEHCWELDEIDAILMPEQ